MKNLFLFFFSAVLFSCSGNLPVKNEVIIHHLADPEMLNPVNYTDAQVAYITNHMFQKLVDSDFRNPDQYVPILAETRPVIEKTPDGKMTLTFRLRKEAKWDNGTPVTARDVEFTLKTFKCPLVNNPNSKSYFDFMNDFKFYDDDPQKFTLISNTTYYMAEAIFTDIPILPEYLYDPNGLLKNITIKMISEKLDSIKSLPQVKTFTDDFNSEKRMRDPDLIGGSGAYKFTQWITNERVILERKKDWWGDIYEKENCFFEAYPEKIIYQTIKSGTTAIVSLKAGNLDVMSSINSKDFIDLPKSEKFTQNFNAYTPMEYSYVYIGLNVKHPLVSDKLTRQALAHIINVEQIIETVKYGMAETVIGPIHPSKKKSYNSDLHPYPHDLEKAKALLAQAGWKNTNGDETLDKIIDGKRTEFVIDFSVNSNSEERKSIGLLFQAEAKKVGITVNVIPIDWAVYLEKCRNHEFAISIGKWIGGPIPDDLKQTFHTNSATGDGSNYNNFSNAEADSLMEVIRTEIDENQRNIMYRRLQAIFLDEAPMIFLYTPSERIAISKKFENAYPSVARPGYWEQGFRMVAASGQ